MRRVPASVRLREDFERAMNGATPEHPMRHFVQRAASLVLQTAIEEQVDEFLGRGHYERGSRLRRGWRNGYEPMAVWLASAVTLPGQVPVGQFRELCWDMFVRGQIPKLMFGWRLASDLCLSCARSIRPSRHQREPSVGSVCEECPDSSR